MNNTPHKHVRRIAGLAALAAGLGLGSALPITTLAEASPGIERASQSSPERQKDRGLIRFAAGSSSGSVNGAVARGDWEHWGARAQRGQTIEVTVSATAGNATFEVYTPAGDQLANDVTSFRGQLPASGLYAIDVGSTGGLANYTLNVSITGEPTAPPPPSSGSGHFQGRVPPPGVEPSFVHGTVDRGDWHEWSFAARGGQIARVVVSAPPAGNATFSLYAPNGDVLAANTQEFVGALPASGLYMVEVGSTGGTASYALGLVFEGSVTPPAPDPDPAPGNSPSHRQGSIQFAPGASSGSVSGSVQGGNWHEWSFKAFGGQSMTLTVSGGATFSLYEPDGDPLAAHTTSFTGPVPATGFYMIEVGAGGNSANYTLNLSIT